MSQVLTFLSRLFRPNAVHVDIRLDRSGIGAHLIWIISNGESNAVTIDRLVFRGAHESAAIIMIDPPRTVAPQGQRLFPIDADWNVLGAYEVAAVDTEGRAHEPPSSQLAQVQDQLRRAIDRRRSTPISAQDFLSGATDLAFGVMILGLGFFMLMWVIATG